MPIIVSGTQHTWRALDRNKARITPTLDMCQACQGVPVAASAGAQAPVRVKVAPAMPSTPPPDYYCYPVTTARPLVMPPAPIVKREKKEAAKPKTEEKKMKTVKIAEVVKKEEKKTKSAKDAQPPTVKVPAPKPKPSTNASPGLHNSARVLLPKRTTYIHVIRQVKVWQPRKTSNFTFVVYKVATSLSVGELIELLLDKEGNGCKGWRVTEVVELGDGEWSKVSFVLLMLVLPDVRRIVLI